MLTKKDQIKNKNQKGTPSQGDETYTHEGYTGYPSSTQQQPAKTYGQQSTSEKRGSKTRVTVKYDAGFPNQLFIRGKGANLSWDKGQPLKNIKPDEWLWETDANFSHCEFKILINDRVYENGQNHILTGGSTLLFTPHFY
jgi:hypothetical protein